MKKALLTATVQSHIGQFHRPLADVLHEAGYEVHVAAKDNLNEKNGLSLDFVDKIYDIPFSRSPKSIDNIKAYFELRKIVKNEHYDIISCNTPMGGIVTRLAAIGTRRSGTKVYYTAHGFHFYKGAPLINWIIYYPIEKIMSLFCDTVITITKEDYKFARKHFKSTVKHIHGVGVYTNRYHSVSFAQEMEMREKEHLCPEEYVILCVGELNDNKNQKSLLAAVELLKNDIPQIRVLLAGNGPRENELRKIISDYDITDKVKMLGYRTDLETITPSVDLVVSCSYREGLPLNILEAELCEKPVIASINRGHNELVRDGITGFKVNADDVTAYARLIKQLYDDTELARKMGKQGCKLSSHYTADAVKKELLEIYCK